MTTFALLAAAALAAPLPATVPSRRVALLAELASADADVRPVRSRFGALALARFAAVAAGVALALALGGLSGLLAGAVVALAAPRLLSRLESANARTLRERRGRDLPDALTLLAAALSTGLPVPAALAAVADALGGPLAPDLARVSELSALGAGPASAWADYLTDPVLGPVARAATRSADSGSALAAAFTRLAEESRADAQLRTEAAARRAGVVAVAPLGLCFLPAFLCLGVAPVLVGIAGQVLP